MVLLPHVCMSVIVCAWVEKGGGGGGEGTKKDILPVG